MLEEDFPIERLCPTQEGVQDKIAMFTRKIERGYYKKRLKYLLGLRRRSASTAKVKYDSIAGQYQARESNISDESRILAIVGDTPCFVLHRAFLDYYRHYLARVVMQATPTSLLEVGAGELNTLIPIVEKLDGACALQTVIALDISAARLAAGRPHDHRSIQYVAASASAIPLPDKSVDVIMTSHCLEQSPELVAPALQEFARVARKSIVLAEPAYDLAHPLQRKRIRRIGYARGIAPTAKRLGLRIISHDLMPVRIYQNGTAVTVVEAPA